MLTKFCQFTNQEFTSLWKAHGIQISKDGKGYWRDNVFVERLWRSLKYEEAYVRTYDSIRAADPRLEISEVLQPVQTAQGA